MTLIDEPAAPSGELGPVIEPLTDEEAALAAILLDPSGLDLAEFLLTDNAKPDLCYRAKPFQWCFAGETEILTREGVRRIGDVVGPVSLLTQRGDLAVWVNAHVEHFGKQRIVELEVERFGFTKVIRTTAEHRWFAAPPGVRASKREYEAVTTMQLLPGDLLQSLRPRRLGGLRLAPYGIVHGLVWGDGTREKNGGCTLRLWGEKLECARYLIGDGVEERRDDVAVPGRRWSLLPHGFKEPVSLAESPSYLYGWLAGYFAADGTVNPDGTCVIESVSRGSLELARDVCLRLGISVGPIFPVTGNGGYGETPQHSWRITIWQHDLPPEFFLLHHHRSRRERHANKEGRSQRDWKVLDVHLTNSVEDVYCAIVPESHAFTLADYIYTGNCWWRDRSPRTFDQCSRDVGKSERMMLRVFALPFTHPQQEMSIFTPEFSHIDKIAERIEMRIKTTWLLRNLTRPGRAGITHRPFKVLWANGTRLISSLPQRSGIGVKGTHSVEVHIEEAQDLSPQAWKEVPNTISWEIPGASWHIHGVSKGVRDDFYDYSTKPELGFVVNRITQMHREDWTEQRRQQLIEEFGGSADSPDYKRNVRGEHGDTANVVFILANLMAGTDTDESSFLNLTEYTHFDVRGPELQERVTAMGGRAADAAIEESSEHHVLAVQQMLDFPALHRERYEVFWAGMDVGLVDDPSEILVFAEYHPDAAERRANRAANLGVPLDGRSRLKLINRISMRWIPAPLQADAIMWVIEEYRPRAFSMDSTGNGLPVFQELQKRAGMARLQVMDYADDSKIPIVAVDARTRRKTQARQALTTIKGYNFSGKVVVGFDDAKIEAMPAGASPQEIADAAGLKTWVKQAATDFLRGIVDTQRHLLPYDKELLRQWNAQTWSYGQGGVDAYGRRKTYSNVKVHTLDAARMAILGRELEPIEEFLREPPTKPRPVYDYFVEG